MRWEEIKHLEKRCGCNELRERERERGESRTAVEGRAGCVSGTQFLQQQ